MNVTWLTLVLINDPAMCWRSHKATAKNKQELFDGRFIFCLLPCYFLSNTQMFFFPHTIVTMGTKKGHLYESYAISSSLKPYSNFVWWTDHFVTLCHDSLICLISTASLKSNRICCLQMPVPTSLVLKRLVTRITCTTDTIFDWVTVKMTLNFVLFQFY